MLLKNAYLAGRLSPYSVCVRGLLKKWEQKTKGANIWLDLRNSLQVRINFRSTTSITCDYKNTGGRQHSHELQTLSVERYFWQAYGAFPMPSLCCLVGLDALTVPFRHYARFLTHKHCLVEINGLTFGCDVGERAFSHLCLS